MMFTARVAKRLRPGDFVAGRVSVIVPTRNSQRTIATCLSSIRAQNHPGVELIVVDNRSTDRTAEIAKEVADLTLTAGPERSAQRNLGAAHSTGEFLVFIDSDMVLPPGLASDIVNTFGTNPSHAALVLPETAAGVGFWARCRVLEKDLYVGDLSVEAARAFRRAIFVQSGGYDESIHGGGEDWDLSERVALHGGRIDRVASVVIHDEGRLSLLEDLATKLYYGRSIGVYAKRHPGRATKKVVRLALVRKPMALMRDPVHGLGLFVLKTLEFSALLVGVLISRVLDHPADQIDGRPEGQARRR